MINFRVPRREYVTVKAGAYSFEVEKSLEKTDSALAKTAVDRLVKSADTVMAAFPKLAADQLRSTVFFLMHGPDARRRPE